MKYFHVAGMTFLFSWEDGINNDLAGSLEFSQKVPVKFLHLTRLNSKTAYAVAQSSEEVEEWREIAKGMGYKEIFI